MQAFVRLFLTITYFGAELRIKQIASDKRTNFPELHIHIMNIKEWLRGIHHHCSKKHLQGYLDEYHYRYNRRNLMDTIFDNLICRMVRYKPMCARILSCN